MGLNGNENTSVTLTIPPEQDPHSIFLNTTLPSSTTTRKRKAPTLTNKSDTSRSTKAKPPNPTTTTSTAKRGRHRTKNLPQSGDMEWAPMAEKRPAKQPTKKQSKSALPQPTPPSPLLPPPSTTSTTSILNTLLQLPANQPKQRPQESNLIKAINQQPSFVNTVLSSNQFH